MTSKRRENKNLVSFICFSFLDISKLVEIKYETFAKQSFTEFLSIIYFNISQKILQV